MGRSILFSLIIFTCLIQINVSQTFFIKVGGGYALSTGSQLLSTTTSGGTTEGHYGSFGEGILPSLGLGYLFNSNVAAELDASYLIGKKFDHQHVENGITETHKQWGEGILLSPALIIQAITTNVIPYARFGGMLGFVKVREETTESGTGARTGTYKVEHTGKIASGFHGAFGLKFSAGKKLQIFTEIFANAITYAPGKRENTETFAGGTLDPTITYEDSFSSTAPNTALTPRMPFSNFGLNLGIIYKFSTAKKKKS